MPGPLPGTKRELAFDRLCELVRAATGDSTKRLSILNAATAYGLACADETRQSWLASINASPAILTDADIIGEALDGRR